MKRQLAETAVALLVLAGTMGLVAWRAYELGYHDASILEADLFCKDIPPERVTPHPVRYRQNPGPGDTTSAPRPQ